MRVGDAKTLSIKNGFAVVRLLVHVILKKLKKEYTETSVATFFSINIDINMRRHHGDTGRVKLYQVSRDN